MLPLLLALVVTGCSSGIQFGYRQLDWLIPAWFERQVALDGGQSRDLREAVDKWLAWHCTTQLPVYVRWLQNSSDEFVTGMGAGVVTARYAEAVEASRQLLEHALPALIRLAATLDATQVAQLLDSVDSHNSEYFAEFIDRSDDELRATYTELVVRQLERWLGDLTHSQQGAVAAWAVDIDLLREPLRRSRLAWRVHLGEVLERRTEPAALERGLRRLLLEWEGGGNTDLVLRYQANTDHLLRFLAELSLTLNTVQQTHLMERTGRFTAAFGDVQCENDELPRVAVRDDHDPRD